MDLSKSYEFFQPDRDKSRIHIIGCGSVGSAVAEELARCGLTRLALWDFDKVQPHNLANQMYREQDVGVPKVEALSGILSEINPAIAWEVKLRPWGWRGERLSGYVFLCVDSIETRREIVQTNLYNPSTRAMFDFRTRLTDAQHYAADWSDFAAKEEFRASMEFTHEEAARETPVSACGVTLGVAPTVRMICALGVANFMNFWNGGALKKTVLADPFHFQVDAF